MDIEKDKSLTAKPEINTIFYHFSHKQLIIFWLQKDINLNNALIFFEEK
jgi:hypothetical protein